MTDEDRGIGRHPAWWRVLLGLSVGAFVFSATLALGPLSRRLLAQNADTLVTPNEQIEEGRRSAMADVAPREPSSARWL